jgi:hypothetical protein
MDSETTRQFIELAQMLKALPDGKVLYGIKKDEVNDFDDSVWINVNDAVNAAIKAHLTKHADTYELYVARNLLGGDVRKLARTITESKLAAGDVRLMPLVTAITKMDDSCRDVLLVKIANICMSLSDMKAIRYSGNGLPRVFKVLGFHYDLPKATDTVTAIFKAITKQYPMLHVVSQVKDGYGRDMHNFKTEITAYLNQCDAMSGPIRIAAPRKKKS